MSDQTPPQYPNYPGSDEQPATPPGYGPPPPAYGNPPPAYGAAQYGPPTVPYASWWSRVGAYLLDGLIAFGIAIVPFIIGGIIIGTTASTTTDSDGFTTATNAGNPLGYVFLVVGYVALFGFQIWNIGVRQGKKGQTLGKQIVGIQVVRAENGQFLGAGAGFLRWLMLAILGGICFLDFLWPLWDDKKQSWHDKIVGSVVLRK